MPKPPVTSAELEAASQSRLIALAKLIAAERMKLAADPLGTGLPEELWRQAIPRARAVLALIKPGRR